MVSDQGRDGRDIRLPLANNAIESGRQVVDPATTLASCLHQPLLDQRAPDHAGAFGYAGYARRRACSEVSRRSSNKQLRTMHCSTRHGPSRSHSKQPRQKSWTPSARKVAPHGPIGTGVDRGRPRREADPGSTSSTPRLSLHQPDTSAAGPDARSWAKGWSHREGRRGHPSGKPPGLLNSQPVWMPSDIYRSQAPVIASKSASAAPRGGRYGQHPAPAPDQPHLNFLLLYPRVEVRLNNLRRLQQRIPEGLVYLTTQGAVANRLEPRLQRLENLVLIKAGELFAKALQVAEDVVIDKADQAEQLQQRILQRRGGEQQLVAPGQRHLQGIGDHVAGLVHIAKPMRFVDDHQVPGQGVDIAGLARGRTDRSR